MTEWTRRDIDMLLYILACIAGSLDEQNGYEPALPLSIIKEAVKYANEQAPISPNADDWML